MNKRYKLNVLTLKNNLQTALAYLAVEFVLLQFVMNWEQFTILYK